MNTSTESHFRDLSLLQARGGEFGDKVYVCSNSFRHYVPWVDRLAHYGTTVATGPHPSARCGNGVIRDRWLAARTVWYRRTPKDYQIQPYDARVHESPRVSRRLVGLS